MQRSLLSFYGYLSVYYDVRLTHSTTQAVCQPKSVMMPLRPYSLQTMWLSGCFRPFADCFFAVSSRRSLLRFWKNDRQTAQHPNIIYPLSNDRLRLNTLCALMRGF